jgi:hypothetical protein
MAKPVHASCKSSRSHLGKDSGQAEMTWEEVMQLYIGNRVFILRLQKNVKCSNQLKTGIRAKKNPLETHLFQRVF